jgi:hypothetical protein
MEVNLMKVNRMNVEVIEAKYEIAEISPRVCAAVCHVVISKFVIHTHKNVYICLCVCWN